MKPCKHGHDLAERYRTKRGNLRCRRCDREKRLTSYHGTPRTSDDPMVPIPPEVRRKLARLAAAGEPGDLAAQLGMKSDRLHAVLTGDTGRVRSRTLDRMVCAVWLVGTVDVMTGEMVA